ncbi:MAG: histidinol dehydrogenase [Pseudomonadales bacterium]|nr:histidinol dehydrogenase [Pseudomonadales bacterium]
MLTVTRLDSREAAFEAQLDQLLDRNILGDERINAVVQGIVQDVREHGDAAVLKYTRQFDRFEVDSMAELMVSREQMQACLEALPERQSQALRVAAERIRHYHEKQKQGSWQYQEADGSVYGQQVNPLDRVGIYIPGGKANYPSSVLMNAIPARVAGVKEIIAVVPTRYGHAGQLIFAAAALAGVNRIFTIGGAQAIAALAYGTQTIPRVDKITGPGNIYVTLAKKQVFGITGIDMIAGPSELTIIADGSTDPDWIAMDLFSQAEHDERAQSILISPDAACLEAVNASMQRLLPQMQRGQIISKSLNERGMLIKVVDLDEAVKISNRIAPEHLEISVEQAEQLLPGVVHAGAIFLGRFSAEALGDYCAGPSHVLPTSGTARFFSSLGVYDFQKRSSIISCSETGAAALAGIAMELAENESLQAHALSAGYRQKS